MADYRIDLDGFLTLDGSAVTTEEIMAGLRERDELKERLESALDSCRERADKIREQDERIRKLDALAGEMTGVADLAERERDAARQKLGHEQCALDNAMRERDALAAHVRALVEWADSYVGTTGLYEEVEAARKADTTSLARLIAEKQAEALEGVLAEHERKGVLRWTFHLERRAAELRLQAQGANNEVEG